MAEEKAEKKAVVEYDSTPAIRSFNNKIDYIYSFTEIKAVAGKSKGTKQEIIIPGFDTSQFGGKGAEAFEKYCLASWKCTPQDFIALALKQIGTRPAYLKKNSIEENQALADSLDLSGVRKAGTAAETKRKATEYDNLQTEMAGAKTDAELLAITKKMMALGK